MNLQEVFNAKNDMVLQGQIVEATQKYFAPEAKTTDFEGTRTNGKEEMVKKMEAFAGAIEKVNEIKLHRSSIQDNHTYAEYTFDFDMKDGNKVQYHEIIQSEWNDQGQIVDEKYFATGF